MQESMKLINLLTSPKAFLFFLSGWLLFIFVGCVPTVADVSPSTIWYWQGYQQNSAGERNEIEIWARIEPPMRHELWRDANGDIVRETIDNGKDRTLYITDTALPWPREEEVSAEEMLNGIQQWSPAIIKTLMDDDLLAYTADKKTITNDLGQQFDVRIEPDEDVELFMFSHHNELGTELTIIVIDEIGHVYVNGMKRDDHLMQMTVFPRPRSIWAGDDPFTPLSKVRKDGVFVSPLPPGSNK